MTNDFQEVLEKALELLRESRKIAEEGIDPGIISNIEIRMSSMKATLGQKEAEAYRIYKDKEVFRKYDESTFWAERKQFCISQDVKITDKQLDHEARISIKDISLEENKAEELAKKLKNIWRDYEVFINALKDKIKTLAKEREEYGG